jgi:Zn-dependent metalloprotease
MKLSGIALTLACLTSTAFANENGTIKIYDAKFIPQIISMFKPGILVMEDGAKKTLFPPKTAAILNKNLEKVRDFYAEEFARKSWDDKGTDILASLNINRFTLLDILGSKQNAAWAKTRFMFGAGDKKGLDNFEKALDVVGHEYTHAVIQETSNLKYEGQSGALNEHLADVFGVIINQKHNNPSNPYLIGSTVLFGGIPNKMSALVLSVIGPAEASKLFYNVMTKRLTENSNFADYRVALMEECKSLSSDTCSIVNDALKAVGI